MIYQLTVVQFCRMLNNLSGILDKSVHYAESKKFEVSILLESRLAPDQFHFIRQVQIACDTAKLAASRLTAKEAPKNEDTEKTIPELKARIQATIQFLESFEESDYREASTILITQPRWEGQYLTGEEYVLHHVIPNFYFHMTTAYAIFRNNGVDVGKKDYLGKMPFKK